MLDVGEVVGGRFRIDRVIGQGGMGIVAAATHLELGHEVAIKMLRPELAHDPTDVERFLREARAVAGLRTEHVCRTFDVGRTDAGAPYIVMELLHGADVWSMIKTQPLPAATAVDFTIQACIALAEAHGRGIVHRDIKPANLFVVRRTDGTPLVKVLDFGIAKAADELRLTQTGALLGSPSYMSPEHLMTPRSVDARTDIWSLGVTLYRMLSADMPFAARSLGEAAMTITTQPPKPLVGDPGLVAVVWRCLEKDREARFQDVGALATALVPFGGPSARSYAALVVGPAAPAVAPPAARNASTVPSIAGPAPAMATASGGGSIGGAIPGASTGGSIGGAASTGGSIGGPIPVPLTDRGIPASAPGAAWHASPPAAPSGYAPSEYPPAAPSGYAPSEYPPAAPSGYAAGEYAPSVVASGAPGPLPYASAPAVPTAAPPMTGAPSPAGAPRAGRRSKVVWAIPFVLLGGIGLAAVLATRGSSSHATQLASNANGDAGTSHVDAAVASTNRIEADAAATASTNRIEADAAATASTNRIEPDAAATASTSRIEADAATGRRSGSNASRVGASDGAKARGSATGARTSTGSYDEFLNDPEMRANWERTLNGVEKTIAADRDHPERLQNQFMLGVTAACYLRKIDKAKALLAQITDPDMRMQALGACYSYRVDISR